MFLNFVSPHVAPCVIGMHALNVGAHPTMS
jgi:hypothetical protein